LAFSSVSDIDGIVAYYTIYDVRSDEKENIMSFLRVKIKMEK
jgi:hypothetical protein